MSGEPQPIAAAIVVPVWLARVMRFLGFGSVLLWDQAAIDSKERRRSTDNLLRCAELFRNGRR